MDNFDMLEAFVVDVNGSLRGKWIPVTQADKIFKEGLRLPKSVFAVDPWGNDVLAAGLVTETGDGDGLATPVEGTFVPAPWHDKPTAQVLLSMSGFHADPRHVLAQVLAQYKKRGLTPVVAAELEFYLIDRKPDEQGRPQPPLSPASGKRVTGPQILGIGESDDFRGVLSDIAEACRVQGIPADTTISENGPAQFEINLNHLADALRAADCAVLLKRAVKGVATKHGMAATFMAKPYAQFSGNGMHVHFSILDKKGKNIFTGKTAQGAPALKHAVAGLLTHMTDCMAIMAPNANSYRRLRPGSHAPTTITWGYDNRSASVRIPASGLAATRIEFRVPGADANPYLVIAGILAAALDGIATKKSPDSPIRGNAYAAKANSLPSSWATALEAFSTSKFIAKYFGRNWQKLYLACKAQEKDGIEAEISSAEHNAYLRDT